MFVPFLSNGQSDTFGLPTLAVSGDLAATWGKPNCGGFLNTPTVRQLAGKDLVHYCFVAFIWRIADILKFGRPVVEEPQ